MNSFLPGQRFETDTTFEVPYKGISWCIVHMLSVQKNDWVIHSIKLIGCTCPRIYTDLRIAFQYLALFWAVGLFLLKILFIRLLFPNTALTCQGCSLSVGTWILQYKVELFSYFEIFGYPNRPLNEWLLFSTSMIFHNILCITEAWAVTDWLHWIP